MGPSLELQAWLYNALRSPIISALLMLDLLWVNLLYALFDSPNYVPSAPSPSLLKIHRHSPQPVRSDDSSVLNDNDNPLSTRGQHVRGMP